MGLLTTGSGGSKSTTLTPHFSPSHKPRDPELEHPFPTFAAADDLFLWLSPAPAPASGGGVRFLLEKNFFSLEYLTILLWLLLLLLLGSDLWGFGKPTILLFLRLTWPMQLILGDRGSDDDDEDLSTHRGRPWTSLMAGLEHNIGKKIVFL